MSTPTTSFQTTSIHSGTSEIPPMSSNEPSNALLQIKDKSKHNLLHVLVSHANERPNHQVFTWCDDKGKESASLTYAGLWNKSVAVMKLLKKKKTNPGERIIIAYPFGLEFLAGIFGAMMADCVPCSVYPPNPSKLATDMPRFLETVKDAQVRLALTTTQLGRAMKIASLVYKSGVKWLPTDRLSYSTSNTRFPRDYSIDPEKAALIQYTSGSTNKPKGVILSHRCLFNNGKAITEAGRITPETKNVMWAPQYHDMGLIVGFVTMLFSGGQLYAFSPLVFLKNPLLWDDLVRRYKAHTTIAPNFGYALLLKRLRQSNRITDWGFMKVASLAAEPTTEDVVIGVHEDLGVPRANIWNVYGMAECGVYITGGPTSPLDGIMSCGPMENDVSSARIVDSAGRVLPPGEEGLIWIRSQLVANGYLNQLELTTDTFHNRIEGETGTWLNTGDLGKEISGTLYVSGRQKEVMIIAGVNRYPTDVEAIVNKGFGHTIRVGRSAAFEFSSQSIGLVCEFQDEDKPRAEAKQVLFDIKRAIQSKASLEVGYLAALKRGCLPKTTSGKLKRVMIKKKCIQGEWLEEEIFCKIGSKEGCTPPASDTRISTVEPQQTITFLGHDHGTGCPHAKAGGLKKFYGNNKGEPYKYDTVTEYATTDARGICAELKEMDTAFPVGLIQRDPYEVGAFRFADHRFWSDASAEKDSTRPRPFALGNPYEEKLKAREWIASLHKNTPTGEDLLFSAAKFLDEHATGRFFNTSSIEKWVIGILYQWIFREEPSKAFIDEFVAFQWRVFDMVMKPSETESDSAVLIAKKTYLQSFVAEKGLKEQHASWAIDLLLFPGIQVCFLLRCGLGVQYSDKLQQRPYDITPANVLQFVWECIRLFPPFPALPWWKGEERHLIVLGMSGVDQSLWGSDTQCFDPNRLPADQFDERSCFFAEQSQLFQCPAKAFALQLASAFFLEFAKTGPWKGRNPEIDFFDVQPYCNDFVLQRTPKVVVVGGGVAGLTCALRLAQRGVQVTVVEKNATVGGHARHAEVLGGHVRNPAFGAFQEDQWPNAVAIMDELQVERLSHGKAKDFASRFARDGHSIPSPPKSTIAAFFADMKEIYDSGYSTQTIGQFLDEKGYDDTFLFGFFFGAIIHHFAGLSIEEYLEIPAHLVAWLSLGDSRFSDSAIYRVKNDEYMMAFINKLESLKVTLHLGCSVEVLSRNETCCRVRLDGEDVVCDQLVLATPPDAAISILGHTRTNEDLLLHSFDCRKETAVFHKDAGLSDLNRSTLAVMLPNEEVGWPSRDQTLPMTTHILSDTDDETSIFATYSYANHEHLPISGDREHITFTHVRITHSAEFLRNRLLESQGRNSTYFAGGWTRGLMLHEDAVVSGALVANSILEAWEERPFPLLSRKVELVEITPCLPTSPAVQTKKHSAPPDSSTQESTGAHQAENFDQVLTAVFGYDVHQELTWADIGLSSLMSVQLGGAIATAYQITLPADWESRFPSAALLKNFVLNNQGTPIATNLPELEDRCSAPLSWTLFGFLQLIGCAILAILFAFPIVLSAYLTAILSEQGSAVLFLYPLTFLLWVLTFTLTFIVTKWVVIGRYTEGQINVSTLAYLRWWFVDRLVDLWESLIGQYIVETPLLNIVYFLAGADIAMSVTLSSLIREFDLVTIEKGTSLSFEIRPRRFGRWEKHMDVPTLRFRRVSVGKSCSVKGLVSLGSNLGDHVVVTAQAVIAEGGQVPSNSTVKGNLASISGSVEPTSSKPANYQWWQLGLLKMLWQLVVLYLFFASLGIAHHLAGGKISTQFRYSTILAFMVDLILGSAMLLVLAVVPLKWIVIGKRCPGPYQDTLRRAIGDYCVDYLHKTSSTFLYLCFVNSRVWNIYFRALGMQVDMYSKFFALSVAPSSCDLIEMTATFASTIFLETKHDGEYHSIHVSEGSIGWNATLGPGVSVSRAAIPPCTYVQQNVIREDPDDRIHVVPLWKVLLEEAVRFSLMTIALGVTFASLIPSAEVWKAFSPNPAASPSATAIVLALAMVLQTTTWVLLARILQFFVYVGSPDRVVPWSVSTYAAFEGGYRWAIGKYSLLRFFSGGPLFNCYAALSGVTMEGHNLIVGNATIYDSPYVTVSDRTVIDSSTVGGHHQMFSVLSFGPSRASGILHPISWVGCNSTSSGAELGPCKFVAPSDQHVGGQTSYSTEIEDEENQLYVDTTAIACSNYTKPTPAFDLTASFTPPSYKLNSGHEMPVIAYGTFRSKPGEVGPAVINAIKAGYRHLDLAHVYGNEKEIGEALQKLFAEGTVKREDLFITGKLWNSDHDVEIVPQACAFSLKDLQLEYFDLYLIHFPVAWKHTGLATPSWGASELGDTPLIDTWRAMEKLVDAGTCKSIGVSNYPMMLMHDLTTQARIQPACNQIEVHAHYQRESLVNYCLSRNICVTAHTPLGGGVTNGATSPLEDAVVAKIARAHKKSHAQVLLRFLLQRGIVVLPKSVKPHRMAENFDLFEFSLTDKEMKEIADLDKYVSFKSSPHPLAGFLGGADAFCAKGTDIFD